MSIDVIHKFVLLLYYTCTLSLLRYIDRLHSGSKQGRRGCGERDMLCGSL